MLQEWEFFAGAWFGRAAVLPPVSTSERQEVEATIESALALERHFYASGGDPRFAERMPVGDELREEMAAEIEYLARNQRRQVLDLHRFEVSEVRRLDDDHLELRTREYWTIRTLELAGDGELDRPRPEVLVCRYLLTRLGESWRVDRREIVPPTDGAEQ
jgi:hypothetical protein